MSTQGLGYSVFSYVPRDASGKMDGPAMAVHRPERGPEGEPGRDVTVEREWGLSAVQVLIAVLAIVACSELIGLLS